MKKKAEPKIPEFSGWEFSKKIENDSDDCQNTIEYEDETTKIVIERELNYDSCYYESDNPTIRMKLFVYKKKV